MSYKKVSLCLWISFMYLSICINISIPVYIYLYIYISFHMYIYIAGSVCINQSIKQYTSTYLFVSYIKVPVYDICICVCMHVCRQVWNWICYLFYVIINDHFDRVPSLSTGDAGFCSSWEKTKTRMESSVYWCLWWHARAPPVSLVGFSFNFLMFAILRNGIADYRSAS